MTTSIFKPTGPAAALAACLLAALAACGNAPRAERRVPVTTAVLASVVEEISGGQVKAEILVPPGACPGHFDLKAAHLRLMEDRGVLFAHGFEGYLERIRAGVDNPAFRVVSLPLQGGWLVPSHQSALYRALGAQLALLYPELAPGIERNTDLVDREIALVEAEIRRLSEGRQRRRALASVHVAEALEYLGFEVVGSYDRKEDLTPATVARLVEAGREGGVSLVVDNLQSGAETGEVFARELGVRRVVFSNFPGVFPGAGTLRETLLENARLAFGPDDSAGP